MLSRDFSGPWQSRAIRDTLQALFLSELLRPSSELWILSAWVSDVEAIDNTARSFSAVRPDWPAASIRLSEVIRVLAGRVGRLCVVVRDVEHNSQFIRTLRDLQMETNGRLGLAIAPTAHEKTIVGEDYLFGGSMNLTRSGLTSSEEHVLLRVDQKAAASRRLALQERWRGSLQWG